MARIWMSGLEAGHMDIFDSYSGCTISATQARTGSRSLYCGVYTWWARAALPAVITEVFIRFGMYTSFGDKDTILSLQDSAGLAQFYLALNRFTHKLEVRRGNNVGTLLGSGGEIHQNRWHCIEIRLLVDNAAGAVQVKVDGTQIIDFAGDTQDSVNADVQAFSFCDSPHGGDGLTATYYDDIAFNDTSGGINDTWIGRGGIPAIFPIGAGASTDLDLFPNTGEANWEDVDEAPPNDDTSYVFDDLVDDHDSYEMDDLIVAGTVAAVQWLARARSDLVGAPEIARILRVGGVDYQGVDVAIDTTYDYYPEIFDEDPNAGPGAWTVAAVNGMEAGVKIRL